MYRVEEVGHSEFDAVQLEVSDTKYATNFGDPRVTANAEAYTHLNATIHVHRPVWSSMVKSILPLLIVLLITMAVFLIDGKYFDARMACASPL